MHNTSLSLQFGLVYFMDCIHHTGFVDWTAEFDYVTCLLDAVTNFSVTAVHLDY